MLTGAADFDLDAAESFFFDDFGRASEVGRCSGEAELELALSSRSFRRFLSFLPK